MGRLFLLIFLQALRGVSRSVYVFLLLLTMIVDWIAQRYGAFDACFAFSAFLWIMVLDIVKCGRIWC